MRMNAASLANHARQHHALHFFGFPALCFPLNDSDGFGQHVPFISIGWAGSPENVLRRVVYSVISCNFKVIGDRKSVVLGKSVSVRVVLGGRRIIKKKKQTTRTKEHLQ